MKTRRFVLSSVGSLLLTGCEPQPAEKPLDYKTTPARAALPIYRFAVHPLHNPQLLAEAYQPLMDYLNRELAEAGIGLRVELEASRDYQSYEGKFRAREPAILLPNPWQTLQAMKLGYRVIAMAGDPEDFKGLFLVRVDSPVRTPADLKGKTVSYPSPTALAAAVMPQDFLHRHGLDVRRDTQSTYVGSQESSIMSVYMGKSEAGATWPPPWRLFQRDHPTEAAQLKVLWETPALVNNSVMLRDDVPVAVAEVVRRSLLNLEKSPEGRAVLSSMSTGRFHAANDRTYDKVRDYVDAFERDVRPVESP